ncbi:MAG: hypothetical protein IPN18_16115 [Ignavibacteriales bacterium]|nr:hypothetical protein [Ignavibacteriales bacterium]
MGAKIAYYNFLAYGALTVTSEATGFPKANLQDYRDYTYWKATSHATQTISANAAPQIGFIGLGQVCQFTYLPDAPFNLGGERIIATQEISNAGNLLALP